MLKKFIYSSLLMIIVIFLNGCRSTKEEYETFNYIENIEYNEMIAPEFAEKGYNIWAETNNARYYFSYGTAAERKQWITSSEIILHEALEMFDMQHMVPSTAITICYRQDTVRYGGRGKSSAVEINPNDSNQIGVLTYFLSGGQLPVWLCAGLELNWLNEYDIAPFNIDKEVDIINWNEAAENMGAPGFGDEWFVPGLIENELSGDILSIAFGFVAYLDAVKQSSKLVEYYLIPQKQWEAEQLKVKAWQGLTGAKANSNEKFVFRYIMNQYFYTTYHEDLIFTIKGELGNYYFSKADWWTYDKVINFVNAGESSIKYVEEWFDIVHSKAFDVFYIVNNGEKKISGQVNDSFGNICVYVDEQYNATGCAHEIVHVILNEHNINTKGLRGEADALSVHHTVEGLCTSVSYLFTMETDNLYVVKNAYNRSLKLLKHYWGDEYLLKYLLIVISKSNDANRLDAITWADMVAIKKMEENGLESKVLSAGEKNKLLLDSDVATSFVLYLCEEKGTKEEFMKVYEDSSLMEMIYGKNLDAMIDEWLGYLFKYYGD